MKTKLLLIIASAILLNGCANEPKPIYNWDGYQTTVYQYYQQTETSPQEQIEVLKKNIETSKAKGLAVAPGLHAHLGLLYSTTGAIDSAMAEFKTEKALYPESAAYMDFLMKNKGKIK
ncbi:Uncharacterised protein [Providencia rustigianii]|nr:MULTISPECIES: DUF4810 domain-containing protein [Providencia]MTC56512.1 DUF4810 domain-containing protein [Providencia rustigianii]MTC58771.1 DUF4810 domain-containing protein [Providencia rustigianii]SPY78837.1 Uncharacterised protein [Providencia rustigianii]SUC36823.1 Uncharacterised protein [Providencia rustigianii]VEB75118.1 Uncharacterised protein [Providencia rustigianii]